MLQKKHDIFAHSILLVMFLTASIFAITKDEAKTIAITSAFNNQISSSNVVVTKELLPPDAQIRCFNKFYASPANPSWMFFSDDQPGANWAHSARVAFVDAVTGEYQLINVTWPPEAASDSFSIEYENVAENVVIPPEPKMLKRTILSSNIARSSMAKPKSVSDAGINATGSKYAVLICGGYSWGSLYTRYYTDIQEMYVALVNTYNYPAENIYVLCADGDADGNGTIPFSGEERSMDLDGNGTIDCNTAATSDNIISTFSDLNTKMTSNDILFVFTTDHGNNSYDPAVYDEGLLSLWNYESMRDDEFADAVNQIENYQYQMFCMEQCFSGDMINDLWGANRVIATAANWDEVSWGRVFSSLWIAAVNGSDPDADVNGDGLVSMKEAFDYAELNDSEDETPQYYETTAGLGATLTLNGLISDPPPPGLPQVRLQINTNGSAPVSNSPQIHFKLLNEDPEDTPVDLAKVEIRYWISTSTTQAQYSRIYYADYREPYTTITGNVISEMVEMDPVAEGQTHYMSVKFSAGISPLLPGVANNVIVQSSFNQADWSNYNQSDDWSYIQTTNFVDANNVAVYYDGFLVWGNEPSTVVTPPPPTSALKVQSSTYTVNPITNQIYINVRIHNIGEVEEDLSSLELKYWYSDDKNTVPEVVTVDWAGKIPSGAMITSQAQASVETAEVAGQTDVVSLSFPGSDLTLEPNGCIEANLRVNKEDWSNYLQTNDYSFNAQSSPTDCNRICLYKNNVLVWGIEP
jgi:hypothetical protein